MSSPHEFDNEEIQSGEPNTAPAGEGEFVVGPNDCMSSVAESHGFFWETLWKLPENEDLKRVRGEPNLLLAGDRVTICPLREGSMDCGTESLHRFRRKGVPARLRVRFEEDGEPRANDAFVVLVDGTSTAGTLDSDGLLDIPIPPTARQAELRIGDDEPIHIALGSMDPVDTWSGIQLRLNNLGFGAGDVTGKPNAKTRSAIGAFQAAHGLVVNRLADAATRSKLEEVHGV